MDSTPDGMKVKALTVLKLSGPSLAFVAPKLSSATVDAVKHRPSIIINVPTIFDAFHHRQRIKRNNKDQHEGHAFS